MKKIFYLMLAVAALGFAACNEEEVQPASFEVVRTDVGFAAEGGEGTIDLVASLSNCAIQENHAVKATTDKEWITIGETTTTKVSFAVAPYTGALNRSGKIQISAGAVSQEVTIIQEATRFDIEVKSYELDPAGQVATRIEYASNSGSAPVVTIPESASWLTAQVVDGAVEFIAELNYEEPRSTTATIQMDWKPIEISLSQGAVNLVTVEEISTKKAAAFEIEITPTEYLPLAAPAWDVATTAEWITLEKTATSFTVSVSENTTKAMRSGVITLTDGGSKVLRTIPVEQGFIGYSLFLGTYTMPFVDFYEANQTATVTIAQKAAGSTYTISGMLVSVTAQYVETDNDAYVSLTYQYVGKSGSYYVHLCPTMDGGSFTWTKGAGMNIVYKNATTLQFVDNGGASKPVIGFCLAAMTSSTASSNAYKGNYENYDNLTTLTAVQ